MQQSSHICCAGAKKGRGRGKESGANWSRCREWNPPLPHSSVPYSSTTTTCERKEGERSVCVYVCTHLSAFYYAEGWKQASVLFLFLAIEDLTSDFLFPFSPPPPLLRSSHGISLPFLSCSYLLFLHKEAPSVIHKSRFFDKSVKHM